jgi:16S rRNA (adenine1518-N6/adenine1519-N6)-dimethyltransferase
MTAHQAKKRFGQNFLHDAQVIARILRAVAPRPGENLVEIGPGLGALTAPLLAAAGELDVVEIDRDVIPLLLKACGEAPGLRITQADALTLDYGRFLRHPGPLRLIGNLPYNISTPLLFHLLGFAGQIRDMHFMLQKEVVERICAGPGEDAYGRLSVAIAARAEAVSLFAVGASAFRPAPQVTSAVVRLRPRTPDFTVHDWGDFDRLVAAAFSQRRKRLSNALKPLLSAAQIAACDVDPGARAEVVPPAAFARLALAWARARPEQG